MDLVAFTEEILSGKLHFLCSVYSEHWRIKRNLNQQRNLKKPKMMKEVISITTKKPEGIRQLLKIFKFWEVIW